MKTGFSIIEFSNTKPDQDTLYILLIRIDTLFEPSLSKRVDLWDYSQKLLSKGKVFSIVNYVGERVGILAIYVNDRVNKNAFISLLGVLPEYQGTSLSSDILMKAIEIAVENGMTKIFLEVSASNSQAISFYRKYGFFEVGRSVSALLMRLDLKDA